MPVLPPFLLSFFFLLRLRGHIRVGHDEIRAEFVSSFFNFLIYLNYTATRDDGEKGADCTFKAKAGNLIVLN